MSKLAELLTKEGASAKIIKHIRKLPKPLRNYGRLVTGDKSRMGEKAIGELHKIKDFGRTSKVTKLYDKARTGTLLARGSTSGIGLGALGYGGYKLSRRKDADN